MLSRDLPCVLLAIDPGATSGWALWDGTRWETGTAEYWKTRAGVCLDAGMAAHESKRPLVVVAETWPGLRGTALAGLGAQWGRWLAELERLDVPAKRVVRLSTGAWRAQVLGGARCRGTDAWKAASRARAHAVLGHDVGPDAADALCIGLAGLRSETVAKALGARELKRLGWGET